MIKVAVRGLRVMGRATQGVHIIRLKPNDKVTDLVKMVEVEEIVE